LLVSYIYLKITGFKCNGLLKLIIAYNDLGELI
jgi:hypothetical protein